MREGSTGLWTDMSDQDNVCHILPSVSYCSSQDRTPPIQPAREPFHSYVDSYQNRGFQNFWEYTFKTPEVCGNFFNGSTHALFYHVFNSITSSQKIFLVRSKWSSASSQETSDKMQYLDIFTRMAW